MGVTLKRGRDGKWRKHWYGDAVVDGKRVILTLAVKVRGKAPESMRDLGDEMFEASKKKAEGALEAYLDDVRRKGRAEHLTERLIESKTGRSVEYARLDAIAEAWRSLGREQAAGERYLESCDSSFARFVEFMQVRNPVAVHLYEVTPTDASAYVTVLQTGLARKTARDAVKLLNKAFAKFLPVGSANPFVAFIGRRTAGDGEMIHRQPFKAAELQAILDASLGDSFMHPLITTAACTGMRRGDVCMLRWAAVDLAGGMLAVKTSKTGVEVEIPIFKPLHAVLAARQGNGSEYVFPEAAAMLEQSPDTLTWRFKKLVAQALAKESDLDLLPPCPAAEIEPIGVAAIDRLPAGARRDRMRDVFLRYCAGDSVRQIEAATGYSKGSVSGWLHAVEELTGKAFLRNQSALSVKSVVARTTRVKRVHGQRSASVRDWHALRATFVTLALSAGVPVELVRRVTGHATVEIVLKHYFRPDRDQFKSMLMDALPTVLTGDKTVLSPAEELHQLTGKIAAGTATGTDRKRARDLMAQV
jgi:integrase